jgi:hypothetical protein
MPCIRGWLRAQQTHHERSVLLNSHCDPIVTRSQPRET